MQNIDLQQHDLLNYFLKKMKESTDFEYVKKR